MGMGLRLGLATGWAMSLGSAKGLGMFPGSVTGWEMSLGSVMGSGSAKDLPRL